MSTKPPEITTVAKEMYVPLTCIRIKFLSFCLNNIFYFTVYVYPGNRSGTIYIYLCVVFENVTTVPSEADVLTAAQTLLNSRVLQVQSVGSQVLSNPVNFQNATFKSMFLVHSSSNKQYSYQLQGPFLELFRQEIV